MAGVPFGTKGASAEDTELPGFRVWEYGEDPCYCHGKSGELLCRGSYRDRSIRRKCYSLGTFLCISIVIIRSTLTYYLLIGKRENESSCQSCTHA